MAKVLIADDDAVFCEMAEDMLASAGHTVSLAKHGRAALDLLQRKNFDLAVIDIHMPEVDGLEVILELKQTVPSLRIIAVTAGSPGGHGDYLRTARIFGASAAVRKPLVTKDFTELVQRLSSEHSSHSDFLTQRPAP